MVKALAGSCRSWHPSGYRKSRLKGLPNFILLIIRTQSEFQIEGRHFFVAPGSAVIFAPNTSYFYENPDGDYIDDWLHFDVEHSSPLYEQLLAMCNEPFPVDDRELFTFCIQHILLESLDSQDPCSQDNIASLFQLMFNHLTVSFQNRNNPETINPLERQMKLLRISMENTIMEEHSIREHARQLQISESYFQYLYKKFFDIPFQQDLIRMRVEHVKLILTTSSLPLSKIAELCGYSNEVHFYRQFKKLTGMSPAQFRKLAAQDAT